MSNVTVSSAAVGTSPTVYVLLSAVAKLLAVAFEIVKSEASKPVTAPLKTIDTSIGEVPVGSTVELLTLTVSATAAVVVPPDVGDSGDEHDVAMPAKETMTARRVTRRPAEAPAGLRQGVGLLPGMSPPRSTANPADLPLAFM
jgi:hypothetical protein